jgi:peptide/nickel transport system ATP-binding protein
MLDVSVRTGILHLFERLKEERDLTILYISHDLSTINYLADRTAIMYLGDIVEIGPTRDVIHDPAHPYTETLLDSVPNPDPDEAGTHGASEGDVPDPIDLPSGCRYHPRCSYATEECRTESPTLDDLVENLEGGNRQAACYHPVNEGT